MTIDHERLLALIAKAGTLPLGHILTYDEQDELLNAVKPLIQELEYWRNDGEELTDQVRFLIDTIGWSPEGTFTFPNGDTWWR